jgi:hypothetical protein
MESDDSISPVFWVLGHKKATVWIGREVLLDIQKCNQQTVQRSVMVICNYLLKDKKNGENKI